MNVQVECCGSGGAGHDWVSLAEIRVVDDSRGAGGRTAELG